MNLLLIHWISWYQIQLYLILYANQSDPIKEQILCLNNDLLVSLHKTSQIKQLHLVNTSKRNDWTWGLYQADAARILNHFAPYVLLFGKGCRLGNKILTFRFLRDVPCNLGCTDSFDCCLPNLVSNGRLKNYND